RTFLVPFLIRKPFEVQSVEPASVDTHTLRMRPAEGAKFEHYPGQFMFLRLKRPGRKSEEHPFTIASSPTLDGAIEATIKESGDFTNTIGETRTGDTASIEAPFGKFSFVYDQPERILFIAGGVGLTPIISMMRFLRDTSDKRPVFLLYGCRKEEEIVLREELDNMPENMQIQYIMSHPEDDWKGPEGFVNKENIEKLVPDAFLGEETHVYLCGPPPMMNMVIRDLGEVGFGKSRLHYEYFSL
ncbi:MAG: FAD-binding oxidoreductase, partial [Candidatus Sumerlaeota bacterium]